MVSQTNEQALEASIEKALAGISREALVQQVGSSDVVQLQQSAQYLTDTGEGYQLGWSSDYDREFAVDTAKFWGFLKTTQPDELAKLKDQPNWQRLVLEHLNKRIKKYGILKLLKTGLSINDAHFTLLYNAPYNDINPDVAANFGRNVFSVTRQLYYSQAEPNLSIDMVFLSMACRSRHWNSRTPGRDKPPITPRSSTVKTAIPMSRCCSSGAA